MHHAVVTVPVVVAAAMLYARLAASFARPGPGRLAALLPVFALLPAIPLALPLYSYRGISSFFLVWLGEFKLLLLASGTGPLDPTLRPLPFVFTAALPVKLLCKTPDTTVSKASKAGTAVPPIVSSAIKVAAMVASLHVLRGKNQMHPYMAFTLLAVIMYCFLDILLPCLAAVGRALGMELEPQFDKPYLAASLQDFWGRRWNLMASAVLRPAVYNPVRARYGAPAGVLATFIVSGLMHEVITYYMTFRTPTGQVTAFFVLQGSSVCAEKWCARRCKARPPRVMAAPLVVGFVAGTAFWLFFPALFGAGMDDLYLAEITELASAFAEAGLRPLRWG